MNSFNEYLEKQKEEWAEEDEMQEIFDNLWRLHKEDIEKNRAEAIDEFVENITLPIISEEQLNDILDKLKEKQN